MRNARTPMHATFRAKPFGKMGGPVAQFNPRRPTLWERIMEWLS